MPGLKALVIVLGILIVAGLTLVAVTVGRRAGGPDGTAASGSTAVSGFGEVSLRIASGARLVDATADGGRLVLRLRLADGTDQVTIVDLQTGRPLGTVRLEADGRTGQ